MKNKPIKKRIGTIMIGAVLVACLTGCGEDRKLNKYIESGEAYIASGNFKDAIEAYQSAIDLDMQSLKAHMGLLQAMVQAQSSYEEIYDAIFEAIADTRSMTASENGLTEEQKKDIQDYYQTAVEVMDGFTESQLRIMEAGIKVLGSDSAIADDYKDKVQQEIDNYLERNHFTEAGELASRLKETLPEDDEVKATAAETQKRYDEEQPYVDVLLKAAELIDAENWQALADLAETEEALALAEKIGDVGNYSYVFDILAGENYRKVIGYYSMEGCDCNEWYYGWTTDGQREGNGGWYWAKNESNGLYVDNYVGEWLNDMPNGTGHMYFFSNEAVIKDEDVFVKDGLSNGTFTHVFNLQNGESYEGSYTVVDGIYQAVEVEDWLAKYIDENKYVFCIVYYDVDGVRNASYLSIPNGSAREGVAHFR